MEITIKKQKDTSILATATISEEERTKAETQALSRLASKVKLKGFRPGKAPPDMVKASVSGEELLEQTVRALLPDIIRLSLEKSGAKPILNPHIGIDSLKPLTIAVTFVEKPKANLRKAEKIRVEKRKVAEPESADIEKFIQQILTHDRSETEVDRPSQMGDAVRVSLSAKDSEGKPVDVLTVPNYHLVIGSEELIPELSGPLTGVKKGEKKTARIAFPKDHEITGLRGKDVSVEIDVKSVSSVSFPALTAEYLKTRLKVEKTPEQFRSDVKEGLHHKKKDDEMKRREDELMKLVRDATDVEFPALLVDSEARAILGEFEERLKSQSATLERWLASRKKDTKEFANELKDTAVSRMKLRFGMEEFAKAKAIEVSDEEVRRALGEKAGTSGEAAFEEARWNLMMQRLVMGMIQDE